jgi:Tfp pilus assembly protein PilP
MKKLMFFMGVLLSLCANYNLMAQDDNSSVPIYSPIGKRDPFQVPKFSNRDLASEGNSLSRYPLEQYRLKAIFRGLEQNQILVEDPKGKSFILNEGEALGKGNATISRVLDTEVIFTEKGVNYLGLPILTEKVLSIPREDGRDSN